MPREPKNETAATEAPTEKTAATQAPTIQDHRAAAGTSDSTFAAVVAFKLWTPNAEVSRKDYDAAVAEVLGVRCGY